MVNKKKTKWIIFLAVSIYGVLLLIDSSTVVNNGRAYDKVLWQNQVGADGKADYNIRAKMIDDVLGNHVGVGMEKSSVEDLLGDPDFLIDNDTGSCYLLRFIKKLSGINSREYLTILYDEKGTVSSIRVELR